MGLLNRMVDIIQKIMDKFSGQRRLIAAAFNFISAEIEAVPAGKARDFGLDRSMIMGYGHDDRCCAFAELKAVLSLPTVPDYTCCGMLVDKEEIGSVGATGMRANYLENYVAELLELTGSYSELNVRRTLQNSRMLSCDVSAGFDPLYASAFEKKNSGECRVYGQAAQDPGRKQGLLADG